MALKESKADGRRVLARYEAGKRRRANHEARWDMIAPYVDPSRYGISQQRQNEGNSRGLSNVYDSQGIFAADLASNYIMSAVCSQAAKWFGLRERRDDLNDDDEVREWLEETRDRMLDDRAAGNFYLEGHEICKDYITFGNGNGLIEENPDLAYRPMVGYRGTRWTASKIGRWVHGQNPWGDIDENYTEFMLDARGMVEQFGLNAVPDKVKKAHTDGKDEWFTVVHGVYPRPGKEQGYQRRQKMPFASCYLEYDSKEVMKEGGYLTNPYVNPRASRVPGEIYGRGRGEIALNDCLTLSAIKRLELEGLALAIRPPWFVRHDAVFGTIALVPAQNIPIRTQAGGSIGDSVQEYQSRPRFDVANIKEEELRKSIRECFYVDQIRELMMIEGRPEMTAYEYSKKLELLHKIAGPFYSGLEHDWLKRDVERQFQLMMDGGAFSPPPDILLEEGGEIDVSFENPLARAQKMDEVNAMDRTLQRAAAIAELQAKYPGVPILDNFPFDEWAQMMAQVEGVPAKLVNSPKQVAVLRKSRAEAEQEQQGKEDLMGMAQAGGQMAPLLKVIQGEKAA